MDIGIENLDNYDIDELIKLKSDKVFELLKDSNELEDNIHKVRQIKETILEEETLDINDENIIGDIELLLLNMPDNLTNIEKIRWIYIVLGHLFSYDYRVVYDKRYGRDKKFDQDKYIGRYQSCIQITAILDRILNTIDGIESKTIHRKFMYRQGHVANEVTVNKTEKIFTRSNIRPPFNSSRM